MRAVVVMTLLASLLLPLSGCKSSAQAYVDENSGGSFIVKGRVTKIKNLHSKVWEHLKDGLLFKLMEPSCVVLMNQVLPNGTTKSTEFELTVGDTIVIADEFDYVLSSVTQQQGQGGPGKPPAGGDGEDQDEGDAGE